jgi:xylulokinase
VYLGIDIGTSSVKAVLVGRDDRPIGQAEATLGISRPFPLWSEQDPDDWWQASCEAVATLRKRAGDAWSAIESVGLSGQMHGAVLLGADDRPLRPAILWNDGRSAEECIELERRWPDLPAVTGNRAMPGFTAPKLLWTSRHEPEVFSRCRRVLLPKDYVRLRMTGEAASDRSDSAGTLWLDVGRRAWSEPALDACGLSLAHMPALYEGPEPTGRLRAEVASLWGLPGRPIVAAGAGDNAAGAIGMGVINPGDAFLSLGTSGVSFVASDCFSPDPARGVHTFCHALAGRWHQMAVHLSAASCLAWLARILGDSEPALLEEMTDVPAAPRGLFFLPYLTGERTPHNDPNAAAAFHGLTAAAGRADLVQAVLEGVAFAFRDGLDAIRATGTSFGTPSLIGGGARSRYWGQVMADVLGLPLELRSGAEIGPAFGAARLARLAATGEVADQVCLRPPVTGTLLPRPERAEAYAAAWPRFRGLYPGAKAVA